MGTVSHISLRLPDYLHERVREPARREGVSINQFITLTVAEKISASMIEEYLEERAGRGSREKCEAVLVKVPDAESEDYDGID